MQSDIAAYVRDVVAVREPAPDLAAIRSRSMRFHAAPAKHATAVMPAFIAIVMLAFVLAGQIVSPMQSTTSVRTPAPAPAPAQT